MSLIAPKGYMQSTSNGSGGLQLNAYVMQKGLPENAQGVAIPKADGWPYSNDIAHIWAASSQEAKSLLAHLTNKPQPRQADPTTQDTEAFLVPSFSGEQIELHLGTPAPGEKTNSTKTLYVENQESFIYCKALLGELCKPICDQQLSAKVDELGLCRVPQIEKSNLSEAALCVLQSLQKFPPFFDLLANSHLALTDQMVYPKPIDKRIVHKVSDKNVLLSHPYRVGNCYWFNMAENCGEFSFDHESDHVQGMLMLEGIRQASIAALHLAGLPLQGNIALLTLNCNFHSFVDYGYPILVRTVPQFQVAGSSKNSFLCFGASQIFQKGRLCAEATATGEFFNSGEDYDQLRKRMVEVLNRKQLAYEKKLNAFSSESVSSL